jgi:phosphoglycolate phosphatase
VTLIFDLDGTLIDSRPGILACFRHTFDVLRLKCPSDAVLTATIGQPFRQAMASLVNTTDSDAVERAVAIYRQRYSTVGLYEASVYGGVAELLASAEAAALYVATSKAAVFAERVLAHFGLARHFRGIFGPDLQGQPAGKTELLRELLRGEQIAGPAAMIGDRAEDIHAGVANRLVPLGVLWGYGAERELLHAGAAAVCRTPNELLSYVRQFGTTPFNG